MYLIDSTQHFTNLRAETLSDTSLLLSWGLLENNLVFQNMTFSIYLGFGIYEDLADTTEDFYFEVTSLSPNVNYTLRVESVIPYSTQMISSTTYHFLESVAPTVSTQTSMSTSTNGMQRISNLSDTLLSILIGGIFIVIILLVFVIITVVIYCIMKRRAVKNTTSPNQQTNPPLFELTSRVNEVYGQASDNPTYTPELG